MSLAKETPKMTGLSTGRPLSPWVTRSQRVKTSWMMRAKARVAMVRYTPVMRRAGSPTSTPVAEVRADAEEGGVAQADQAGIAGEGHEAEPAQAVDQHEADVDEVGGHEPGQEEEDHEEGRVPVPLHAVREERQVLRVGGLEEEAHAA